MCKNATSTAASLMAAIKPSLVSLLTYENIANTPNGIAAINAYDAALAAVQNWKSGTTATDVLQVIAAFQTAFNALPIPPADAALANIILAGVEAVIGVLAANSPAPSAPTPTVGAASEEEITAAHQAQVAVETEAKVIALVPEFKRSIWHSAAHQYKSTWNGAVHKGNFPATLDI